MGHGMWNSVALIKQTKVFFRLYTKQSHFMNGLLFFLIKFHLFCFVLEKEGDECNAQHSIAVFLSGIGLLLKVMIRMFRVFESIVNI